MHSGKVKEYSNTTCSYDYLEAVKTGKIKNHDVLVQLSLTVLSSTKTRIWIAGSLCTLSTIYLPICTTRRNSLSLQDLFWALRK
jgi:hypothetical protein